MALTKEITVQRLGQDLTFPDAYINIKTLNGDKKFVSLNVVVYSDSEKIQAIDCLSCSFEPDLESGVNFIAQGYNYLKTRAEYLGAVDC